MVLTGLHNKAQLQLPRPLAGKSPEAGELGGRAEKTWKSWKIFHGTHLPPARSPSLKEPPQAPAAPRSLPAAWAACPGRSPRFPAAAHFCREACSLATAVPRVLPKERRQSTLPSLPQSLPRTAGSVPPSSVCPALRTSKEGRGVAPQKLAPCMVLVCPGCSQAISSFSNLNIANQLLQALTYVL